MGLVEQLIKEVGVASVLMCMCVHVCICHYVCGVCVYMCICRVCLREQMSLPRITVGGPHSMKPATEAI